MPVYLCECMCMCCTCLCMCRGQKGTLCVLHHPLPISLTVTLPVILHRAGITGMYGMAGLLLDAQIRTPIGNCTGNAFTL